MIEIKSGALNAMLNLSGKKDIRYYLNGVLVQVHENRLRLVATDGHVMGIYQDEIASDDSFQIVIPNEIISKLDKKQNNILTNADGVWKIDNISFAPIDGQYPDYMRVLPREPLTKEMAQFNPDFITRFHKVAKGFGFKAGLLGITHNGQNAALVDIGMPLNFVGIMMPLRSDMGMTSVPAWLNHLKEVA